MIGALKRPVDSADLDRLRSPSFLHRRWSGQDRRCGGKGAQGKSARPGRQLAGREMSTLVGDSGRLTMAIDPLCASTMALQMARPRPTPPVWRARPVSIR